MTTAPIEDFNCLELVQGSSEWLESRKNYVGASEASVIMGQNKYKTQYQLWQQKLGICTPEKENFAMARGARLEPQARKQFEEMSGVEMPTQPVIVHPEYDFIRVSLDGISECGKWIAEIKCPMRMDGDSHMSALFGGVSLIYYAQVQLQLACCPDVKFAYYFSYDEYSPEKSVIIEVARDQGYIDRMIIEIEKFWQCVKTKSPPKMKEDEYKNIELDENKIMWQTTVSQYLETCLKAKNILETKDKLKDKLLELSAGRNVKGFGVSVCFFDKKGSVDYKKIPELRNIDLDKYRKDSSVVNAVRIG